MIDSQNNDRPEGEHGMPPGWKENLASTSEAFVKASSQPPELLFIPVLMHQPQADRSGPTSTTELQARTVQFVTEQHSPDEHGSSTTASYSRDEVSGPLKSAPGCEDNFQSHETVKKVTKKATKARVGERVGEPA